MAGTKGRSSSRSRNQVSITYTYNEGEEIQRTENVKDRRSSRSARRDRVHPTERRSSGAMDESNQRKSRRNLTVETGHQDEQRQFAAVPQKTPAGVRGSRDLRSPGAQKTPVAQAAKHPSEGQALPDFITQTDASGRATTPRSAAAIDGAKMNQQNGQTMKVRNYRGRKPEDDDDSSEEVDRKAIFSPDDPCDALLESLRMMCCCFMEDGKPGRVLTGQGPHDSQERPKILGNPHPDDIGKKCLVLDLDETLVHSSFRAVPGADFVIPVQIEDVVHFVYVMKRPGVDEFLLEMAKHYEIVIYTASLNKYADPLLDLLDPHRVIRFRLFRESCVYFEGNYVKDLSLLDRDLKDTIIIDNSPSSYLFHPENAIDCSSFIDDPNDRELDQIGSFLTGIKDISDVRGISPQWRNWPSIDLAKEQHDDTR